MGRKRKNEEDKKVPRTVSLPKWMWDKIIEWGKKEGTNISNTLEKILSKVIKR